MSTRACPVNIFSRSTRKFRVASRVPRSSASNAIEIRLVVLVEADVVDERLADAVTHESPFEEHELVADVPGRRLACATGFRCSPGCLNRRQDSAPGPRTWGGTERAWTGSWRISSGTPRASAASARKARPYTPARPRLDENLCGPTDERPFTALMATRMGLSDPRARVVPSDGTPMSRLTF